MIVFLLDGEERLYGDAPAHAEVMERYCSAHSKTRSVQRSWGCARHRRMNVPMHHAMVRQRALCTLCVATT